MVAFSHSASLCRGVFLESGAVAPDSDTAPCCTAEQIPLSIDSRLATAYSNEAIAFRLPNFRDLFRNLLLKLAIRDANDYFVL